MTKIVNDRLLRALNRQPVDRTPAWIMRQAGRYMPEYRAIREQAKDFLTLCKTPELACKITLLPIRRFALDAAILFSDILMLPEAMGLGLSFVAEEGPKFSKTINTAQDVQNLPHIDPQQDLAYVSAAIQMINQELAGAVPLIGFAGSPWTVATYMVEGQTSKQFYKIKNLLYRDPQTLHKLLSHMALQITHALQAQIVAGVHAVMLFDSWGGVLTDELYKEFSLQYMAQIVTELKVQHPAVPIILFSKNGGRCLLDIAATGCNAIGLDWTANLSVARATVDNQVALQGNLDPSVLYASPERIIAEVQTTLAQYGSGSGHVFNLGHGIPPDVNPAHVEVMLEAIHTYSPAYHKSLAMV